MSDPSSCDHGASGPQHEGFLRLKEHVDRKLQPGEDYTLWLQAEESDFVRFNHGRVRQAGSVKQTELTLRLIRGQRHAASELSLSGEARVDRDAVEGALLALRATLAQLSDDPHLLWQTKGQSSTTVALGDPLNGREITAAVLEEVDRLGGLDMVGVLVSGGVHVGFASSRGQVNWDSRESWLLDWCLYQDGDKAVKSTLGGSTWDPQVLRDAMTTARAQLPVLARPTRRLSPGAYRVWLSPAALAEVMELLSWGAFSHRAQEARNSPLLRMLTQGQCLDPRINLVEDVAGGLSPGFSPDGFVRPDVVTLIDEGRLVGSLVSPRSAVEYGLPHNGASGDESPSSLSLRPGTLADDDVLSELDTGLYISNLWYLNYSDRSAGRLTGMTRFATTWVEKGEVVAPTEVMRFDETIFHLLGDGLQALGQHAPLQPSTSTYERRSTDSIRLPGALVDGMRFTL